MYKIEIQPETKPDIKYRIVSLTYKEDTHQIIERYVIENKTLLEVAQFMKGRGEPYLEDDILSFFQDMKQPWVYVTREGKLITQAKF